MADVAAALRAVVGPANVLTAPELVAGHLVDWTRRWTGSAVAVVRPGSTDEAAEVVRWCRAHHTPLVPQGGNTGLVGGAVPDGGIVLSTARLSALGDVDVDAGQVTAGAGVTVETVQRAAAAAGWRYGVDFAARGSATIGGTVATNAGGLRVLRHGATRAQLLGVEAVLGTGEVVSHLGGLVKDNTGYDLAGLLCGSEGTLGVVTAARVRLVAPAGSAVTALVGFPDVAAAVAAVGLLRRRVPTLEAAELVLAAGLSLVAGQAGLAVPLADPVAVLVEATGPPDPTAALAGALEEAGAGTALVAEGGAARDDLWRWREAHTEAISRVGVPLKFDVTLPSHALARFCGSVPAVVATAAPSATTWLFGHVADGNVHVNVTGADPGDDRVDDAVLRHTVSLGGSISAEHGIGRAKRPWLHLSRSAAELAAMRAVKAALDPEGICNPGVLL